MDFRCLQLRIILIFAVLINFRKSTSVNIYTTETLNLQNISDTDILLNKTVTKPLKTNSKNSFTQSLEKINSTNLSNIDFSLENSTAFVGQSMLTTDNSEDMQANQTTSKPIITATYISGKTTVKIQFNSTNIFDNVTTEYTSPPNISILGAKSSSTVKRTTPPISTKMFDKLTTESTKSTLRIFTLSTTSSSKTGIISTMKTNAIVTTMKLIHQQLENSSILSTASENMTEINFNGTGQFSIMTVHKLGDKEDDRFWPVAVGLTIGIPTIIIIGVTITVMHRKRLGRRARSRPNKLASA